MFLRSLNNKAIATTVDVLLELDGKILLLKIPEVLATGHGETRLGQSQKLQPCWKAFMVP